MRREISVVVLLLLSLLISSCSEKSEPEAPKVEKTEPVPQKPSAFLLFEKATQLRATGTEFLSRTDLTTLDCLTFGKYSYALGALVDSIRSESSPRGKQWMDHFLISASSKGYSHALLELSGNFSETCPFFKYMYHDQDWAKHVNVINDMLQDLQKGASQGLALLGAETWTSWSSLGWNLNAQVQKMRYFLYEYQLALAGRDQKFVNFYRGKFIYKVGQVLAQYRGQVDFGLQNNQNDEASASAANAVLKVFSQLEAEIRGRSPSLETLAVKINDLETSSRSLSEISEEAADI